MFKEITAISKNYAWVKIEGTTNEDLLNMNLVFEDNGKRILGEVDEVDDGKVKVSFLGEFVNNRFQSGIIRKPSLSATVRVISKEELSELVGDNDKKSMILGLSPLYNDYPIKINIDDMWSNHNAFFGNTAGCIGEVSAILLLAGGLFLIFRHVISWRIPAVFIGTFALFAWAFGGIPYGLGVFHGEILVPVFSGGLMLGAFFMATDWVTTPTTAKGEIIFAVGCGLLTFIIRYFGALPEGVSLAIILMNIVSPTIDRYIRPKKFGYVKELKEKEAK